MWSCTNLVLPRVRASLNLCTTAETGATGAAKADLSTHALALVTGTPESPAGSAGMRHVGHMVQKLLPMHSGMG
jgi:hypothetical protein